MRLQLSALLLVALLGGPAAAEERVLVTGHLYSDSMGTLVATPLARVDADLGEELSFSGRVVANGVTAASRVVDGVTAASTEVRKAGSAVVGWERGYTRASGLVEYSHEPDYSSTTVGLGVGRDLAQRCTTVELFWWHGFDRIDPVRIGVPDEEPLAKDTDALRATLTQVLGRGTVGSATYELTWVRGYQANPYYTDLVAQADEALLYIGDSAPDRRLRHAASGRLDQWLPIRGALHPQLRLYTDDWGVQSVTAELSYAQHLGERVVAGARYRHYRQSSADFHQDSYSAADLEQLDHHSLDFKYDAMVSHAAGLRLLLDLEAIRRGLHAEWIEQLSLHGSYDRYLQQHDDWSFAAHMGQAGLSTTF